MRFHSDGVDAGIGTASSSHPLQLFDEVVDFVVIQDLSVCLTRHVEAIGETIDSNYASCAQQKSAADSKLPHRPASPDSDDIAGMNVAILGRHVPGGKNI